MTDAIRCLVSGRVQGVYFRGSTREQAYRLNLTGVARNLPDGRVEVIACGDQDALAQLREWLEVGPSGALVSGVECAAAPVQDYRGFRVA